MYRFSANSRATISSTAIFFSQQSRQYRSSPRGSDTSLAAHSAHLVLATADLRAIDRILNHERHEGIEEAAWLYFASGCSSAGTYISRTYCLTIRRVLKRGSTVRIDCLTTRSQRRGMPWASRS